MLLPFWIVLLLFFYLRIVRKPLPSWRIPVVFLVAFLFPLVGWSSYLYLSQGVASSFVSHVPSVIAKSLNLKYEAAPPERIDLLVNNRATSAQPVAATEAAPALTQVLVSKIKNVFLFWNPGAGGYQAQAYIDRYDSVAVLIWLYRIGFLLLLLLAFFVLRSWRDSHIALLWMVVFYFWGVHSALFPYPRYMLPLIPIVLLFAALTAVQHHEQVNAYLAQARHTIANKLRGTRQTY
jgi:hypothetical protein